jgi:hypothetical protein
LQNESDFLAINFLVSIQWYSYLIKQCHCSLSIVKGQLNSSINKAPSYFAKTENLQQEDSDVEHIACRQGSSELKQKRRKASAHPTAAVQNVDASRWELDAASMGPMDAAARRRVGDARISVHATSTNG